MIEVGLMLRVAQWVLASGGSAAGAKSRKAVAGHNHRTRDFDDNNHCCERNMFCELLADIRE
jgi:hypothetical protein